MFSKVLVILVCAAGAAALVSCAMAPLAAPAPPSPESHSQNTHSVLSNDHSLENAIEMVMDGKYADASRVLEQLAVVYDSAKDSAQAAEATFWMGYCKEKSGNRGEAAACYRRTIERYPQTAAARNAQDRLDALGPQP